MSNAAAEEAMAAMTDLLGERQLRIPPGIPWFA
jgi:hypothetical protein